MTRNLDVRDYFLFTLTAITAKNIAKNYNMADYFISFNDVYDTFVNVANETIINRQNKDGVGVYFASESVTPEAFENEIREDKNFFWLYDSGVIVISDFMDEIVHQLKKGYCFNLERISKEPMSILNNVKEKCKETGVIHFEEGEDFQYSNQLIDAVNTVFAGTSGSNPTFGDN